MSRGTEMSILAAIMVGCLVAALGTATMDHWLKSAAFFVAFAAGLLFFLRASMRSQS